MMRVVSDVFSAIGLAVTSLGLRFLADRWLGPLQPFAPGYGVIAGAVWLLGPRVAGLTAVLCYVSGTYFFVEPRGHLPLTHRVDAASFLSYAATAGIIVFIGHRARLAEQRLRDANASLRQADQNKDAFLATLSHELRNPLATMLSATTVLQRLVDDRGATTVAIMQRQCRHMKRLVDDMLDVERIARGVLTLDAAVTDLRLVIEQAAEAMRDATRRRQQSLTVRVPDAPVLASVDSARLVQVLVNLLDNACKYAPEDASLELTLSTGTGQAVIIVADDGPGIDENIVPDLFSLHGSLRRTRSPHGLGIGLGLCRHLVDLHGGSMTLDRGSASPGTRWVIRLPAASGGAPTA